MFRTSKWKFLEASWEIDAPLAHDIVRGNLLRLRIVGGASSNHIVGISVPVQSSITQASVRLITNRSPFWRGPAPSGRINSCRQVVHTIPEVA